jgi:hypothetical protein
VLEKQKRVGDVAAYPRRVHLVLERKCVVVIDQTEAHDPEFLASLRHDFDRSPDA